MQKTEVGATNHLFLKAMVTLLMCALLTAIFYVQSISLLNVLLALSYGVFCIIIPGFLIQTVLIRSEGIGLSLRLSLSLMIGIGLVVFSYFSYISFRKSYFLYIFILPYASLAFSQTRRALLSAFNASTAQYTAGKTKRLVILGLIFSMMLIYHTLYYPMLGRGPILQDSHPFAQSSYLVAFMKSFPGVYMSMSGTADTISYNSLANIIGVNFCLITGVSAHLFFLGYFYFIFTPFYFLSALFLLVNMEIKGNYVLYGTALLAFGGEFLYGPMYVLQQYQPQLLGMILFFNILSLIVRAGDVDRRVVIFLLALGAFLLVGARLPGALAVAGGLVVYSIYCRLAEKDGVGWKEVFTFLAFFSLGFFIFFLYGATNHSAFTNTDPLNNPFYYLFQYFSAISFSIVRPVIPHLKLITENIPMTAFILSVVGLLYWPIGMFFHFSFTIPVWPTLWEKMKNYRLRSAESLCLCLAVFVYLTVIFMDTAGGGQYYYMDYSFKCLLLLFLLQIQEAKLFEKIRGHLSLSSISMLKPFAGNNPREDSIKSLVMVWAVILIIPFYSCIKPLFAMASEFHSDLTIYNLYASSKFYPQEFQTQMFAKVKEENANYIDKDMYNVFAFIRENSPNDRIVVVPDIVDHYDHFITALTERTAYLENTRTYSIDREEAERRKQILLNIKNEMSLDSSLQDARYLFVLRKGTFQRLAERYSFNLLYESGNWCVSEINEPRDRKG